MNITVELLNDKIEKLTCAFAMINFDCDCINSSNYDRYMAIVNPVLMDIDLIREKIETYYPEFIAKYKELNKTNDIDECEKIEQKYWSNFVNQDLENYYMSDENNFSNKEGLVLGQYDPKYIDVALKANEYLILAYKQKKDVINWITKNKIAHEPEPNDTKKRGRKKSIDIDKSKLTAQQSSILFFALTKSGCFPQKEYYQLSQDFSIITGFNQTNAYEVLKNDSGLSIDEKLLFKKLLNKVIDYIEKL